MIRNVLYSVFIHVVLVVLIYTNFKFTKYKEHDSQSQITVTFMVNPGTSEEVIEKTPEVAIPPLPKKTKEVKKPVEEKKKEKAPEPKIAPKEQSKVIKKKVEQPETEAPIKKAVKKPEVKKTVKKEVAKAETQEKVEPEIEVKQKATPETSKKLEAMNLSKREIHIINTQMRRCYKRAVNESKSTSKTPINIYLSIEENGTIDIDYATIEGIAKYNDPKEIDYRIAVDNVKKALAFCSPLRNLPQSKHAAWKDGISFTFEPNKMQE